MLYFTSNKTGSASTGLTKKVIIQNKTKLSIRRHPTFRSIQRPGLARRQQIGVHHKLQKTS